MPKTAKNKEPDFEQLIRRLSEIVSELEDEVTGLERAVDLYREGAGIGMACLKKLESAEAEISVITKEIDGFTEKALK